MIKGRVSTRELDEQVLKRLVRTTIILLKELLTMEFIEAESSLNNELIGESQLFHKVTATERNDRLNLVLVLKVYTLILNLTVS
jgi:hypothetical protein